MWHWLWVPRNLPWLQVAAAEVHGYKGPGVAPGNRQLPLCLLLQGGGRGTSGPAMESREAPNGCLGSVDCPPYTPASRSWESSSCPRSLENPWILPPRLRLQLSPEVVVKWGRAGYVCRGENSCASERMKQVPCVLSLFLFLKPQLIPRR